MAKLLYQGHGSMRLISEGGTVVYIDPFAGEGYDRPADLILVTHQHHDHNQIQLPPHADNCRIIQNMDALGEDGYRSFLAGDIEVEATQAYNEKHPKSECVGYLVRVDGVLLYFSGDTQGPDRWRRWRSGKSIMPFLPIDGFYTMDTGEAVECAELIRAKHTIPVHMAPGKLFDPQKAAGFVTQGAMIVEPGKRSDYDPAPAPEFSKRLFCGRTVS